jgi:hypothetical protein
MTEQAWLIESCFRGVRTQWWNGLPLGCGQSFTTDPNEAVRFSRQIDAERVSRHMHMTTVTEHLWIDRATVPATACPHCGSPVLPGTDNGIMHKPGCSSQTTEGRGK